jgi:hypothetical protein
MNFGVDFEGNHVSEEDGKVALKIKVAMRELSRDSEGEPDKFRIEFLNKGSNHQAFVKFYKECLKDKLYMFVENGEEEE